MRPEKESMLSEIRARVEDSVFLILTDINGINSEQDVELRKVLRDANGEIHIVKNRMLKHVVKDMNLPELEAGLTGQTAMVTGSGEVSEIVKALKDFIKKKELPVVKMGAMDGVFLTAEQIDSLANLPSRPQLYAMLLGVLQAPARNLLGTLNEGVAQIVRVLKAYHDKKGAA